MNSSLFTLRSSLKIALHLITRVSSSLFLKTKLETSLLIVNITL